MPAAKRGLGGADSGGVVRYSRFEGGDFGVLQGFRAPRDSFQATDMIPLLDGSVCPRPGTTAIVTASQPTGTIAGLGFFNQDVGTAVPWFVVGTAAYASVTTPVALTGALASTPTLPLQGVPIADKVYISNYGDKLYRLSLTNCDPMGLTPGGKCACAFGDRLLVANFPANANRVIFSAANDFTSYPALNFFDVGQGGQIVGMWGVRSNIFIAKNDGSWWIYTGVPGSGSDVLRLAYTGLGFPADWRSGAVVGGSSVYFVASGEQFPSYFNGSNVTSLAEQDTLGNLFNAANVGTLDPAVSIYPLSRRGDFFALPGRGLTTRTTILSRDGKWSRHNLPSVLAAPVPGSTRVLVTDGGGAGVQATFAWWVPTGLERPPLGGTYDAVTDVGTTILGTLLTLPEYVEPDGRDMKVQKVLVTFRRFNQTASNRFKVRVVATHRADGSPDASGTYRVYDEPSTFGSATGVTERLKFMAVDQGWGTGWRVELGDIRGVIIDDVSVYYEAGRIRP